MAQETERFFRLPDLWMASELLRLARQCRSELPDEVCGAGCITFEKRLLWDVIPELAYRLGARRFLPGERTHPDLQIADDFELRVHASAILMRTPTSPPCPRIPPEWALLTREVALGNVIAIAIDRVAPPIVASDFVAATLHRAWSGIGQTNRLTWSPDLIAEPLSRMA